MSNTVYETFCKSAKEFPNNAFLCTPDYAGGSDNFVELTYGEMLARVDATAAAYRAAGYGPKHRVAVLLENRPEFLMHFYALNSLGAGLVPLNPDYRAAELEYVLGHSGATLVVALDKYKPLIDPASAKLGTVSTWYPESGAAMPAAKASLAADASPLPDECALLDTSGTTGQPKGCVLSNRYFLRMAEVYLGEGGLCEVRRGVERLITPLPLFHMNALCASAMAMLVSGGCIVQLDRFHPRRWWKDVAASGATIVHYLGVMPAILLSLPPDPLDRAHTLRFGFGANADPRQITTFEERYGFPLIESWAMSETGGGACITASREPRHLGTRCIGTPGKWMELRLVDETDQDVPEGEPGELLVRRSGPDPRDGFFSCYLKDPAATDTAWRGGWFHTGDVARRGPDGQMHFVDRRKNIIRRSGENIAALEVESVLQSHPEVDQVAIVAVPDPVRDEEVFACIVARNAGGKTEAVARSIQAYCLERLAYFKAPGYVSFVETLPRTSTNKLQKGEAAKLGIELLKGGACFDLRDGKKRQAP